MYVDTMEVALCFGWIDSIQHYKNTGRPEQAETALKNFIRDCHNGKMSSNWSDFCRLENY